MIELLKMDKQVFKGLTDRLKVDKKTLLFSTIAVFAFATVAAVILMVNAKNPVHYTVLDYSNISFEKGVVTAVLEEDTAVSTEYKMKIGYQKIRVRLTDGPQKGEEVEIFNVLSLIQNVSVQKGTRVIVRAERPANIAPNYLLHSYNRVGGIVWLGVILAVVMIAACAFKGFRSILGLGVSMFFVFALLIPSMFRGESPVLMAILTAVLTAGFSLILLYGFNRKTLTAFAAVILAVLLSALIFLIITAILRLTGYNIPEAESLLMVSSATGLKVGEIMFAGILISCLGAIIDMVVSVASSMYEAIESRPDITPKALFKSGMKVGRDMAGATCQTLILAFIGSTLAMVISVSTYHTNFTQVINSNYAAIEIAQGITGALAVIAAVPLTAAICVFLRNTVKKRRTIAQA